MSINFNNQPAVKISTYLSLKNLTLVICFTLGPSVRDRIDIPWEVNYRDTMVQKSQLLMFFEQFGVSALHISYLSMSKHKVRYIFKISLEFKSMVR